MNASQRRCSTVCSPTPVAMITPLQSWIVVQSAVLTPRIAGAPDALIVVTSGNSRTIPVIAQRRNAMPVTMSTQ